MLLERYDNQTEQIPVTKDKSSQNKAYIRAETGNGLLIKQSIKSGELYLKCHHVEQRNFSS